MNGPCIVVHPVRALGGRRPPRAASQLNPFTLSDCVDRFMTWAGWAATPISPGQLRRFVEMVEDLEHVKDAGEMVPLLA